MKRWEWRWRVALCTLALAIVLGHLPAQWQLNLASVVWLKWLAQEPPARLYAFWEPASAPRCGAEVLSIQAEFKQALVNTQGTSAVRRLAETLIACEQTAVAAELLMQRTVPCDRDKLLRLLAGAVAFRSSQMERAASAWDCANLQAHLLWIAQRFMDRSQLEEAFQLYRVLVHVDGTDALAHWGIGNTYSYRGDWQMALPAYRRAAELAPDQARVLASYALALLHGRGDDTQARALLLRAIALKPDDLWLYGSLSDYYVAHNEYERAEPMLLDVANRFPNSHVPSLLLGSLYLQWGKTDLAVNALSLALRKGDPSGQTADLLGEAYRRRGAVMQAIQARRLATQQAPQVILYGLNLALTYAEAGQCALANGVRVRLQNLPHYEPAVWSAQESQLQALCG